MIKAVIIDDEINSRELLQAMLVNYIEGVKVLGTAKDVATGIKVIQECQPDLVLLDIEMPGGDGFKVLDAFDKVFFKVIFITGFVEYAIKAIKYSALDYILKPVDLEELQSAIIKVTTQSFNTVQNFELLKSYTNEPNIAPKTIVIRGVKKQYFLATDQVIALLIENGFTSVITHKNERINTLSSLIYFEGILPEKHFMRIHKSALINLNSVEQVDHGRTGNVLLKNGMSIPFSSRKKAELLKRLTPE